MLDQVPSILIVSWNRREYFERMIGNLLADQSDYRLYFWDNGSADGVADLIKELDDPRIAGKHLNPENVGQFTAWHWFLDTAEGDIGGKLDDDIIGRQGWMTRLSAMLAAEDRFGVLGGWMFQESDWDEQVAAHKIVKIGSHHLFENLWVGGCMFLGRMATLRKYSSTDSRRWGVPILQSEMVRDGKVNGFPLPLEFAENLDDPRSPFCRMNRPGGWDEFAAYTARVRKFSGPEEYGRWIAQDARTLLETPVSVQLRQTFPNYIDRWQAKLGRGVKRFTGRGWIRSES